MIRRSPIDRAPLGDMPTALLAVLLSERPVDVEYSHKVGSEGFWLDSSEVRKELEDIPLAHPKVRGWILQTLREGEASLSNEVRESPWKEGGKRMVRLKNIEELKKIRQEAQKDLLVRTQTGTRIIVGMGTCGIAAGAREVMHAILKELETRKIEAHVETVGCVGMCAKEPLVDIEQAGKSRVRYANILPENVPKLIEEHLVKGNVVQEWAVGRVDAKKV